MPQPPSNLSRFGSLLGALLLLLLLVHLVPERRLPLPVVSILFSVLMIAAVYAVSERPRVLAIGLALALPTVVTEWLTNLSDRFAFLIIDYATSIVFLTFVMAVLLLRILRQQDASADSICGGICVYLLAGVMWAEAYDLIETVIPGSFSFGEGPLPEGFSVSAQAERSQRFLFFSFVTLTTLGYGDITPLSSQARGLAILEAVAGPLFLAIFISRLVGLHMARARDAND